MKISVEASLRFQLLLACEVINHNYFYHSQFPSGKMFTRVILEIAKKATIDAFKTRKTSRRTFGQSDIFGLDFFKTHMHLDECCNNQQHPYNPDASRTHRTTTKVTASQAERTFKGPAEYPP